MRNHFKIVVLLLFIAFASCVNIPKGVIRMDKMENILVDIHTAEAISDQFSNEYNTAEQKQRIAAEMLKKNGVTKAEFDSSLSFYSTRLDLYMKIYQKVSERLNAQKELLSESVLAYERALLTPYGDSVDIWNKNNQLILVPGLTANKFHEIKVDSNFRDGDKLVLNFKINNAPIDSSSYILAILGKSNATEKVTAKSENINKPGWANIEIEDNSYKEGENIYVTYSFVSRNRKESEIYIDSISLYRYHKPKETVEADSLANDSTVININSNSLSGVTDDKVILDAEEVLKIDNSIKKEALKKNTMKISPDSKENNTLIDKNSVNVTK